MNPLRKFRSLFRRRQLDAEMHAEIQAHVDQQTERNVATGMTPKDARYAALRQFGNVAGIQQQAREGRGWLWLEQFVQDLGFGCRQLGRKPLFTSVAVVTLALGIGMNALLFSIVRDMVLRPLLRDQKQHLAALYNSRDGANRDFRRFSHAEFDALREPSAVFSDVAAIGFNVCSVGRPDDLRNRYVGVVSENYFALLGVQPFQGRFFSREEARPEAAVPVAVTTYALWERLGRPDNFVGSLIQVNQRDYTVIGIAPPGFVGLHISIGPEIWVPLGEASQLEGQENFLARATSLTLVGGLQPALPLEVAQTRLDVLDRRVNALAVRDNDGPRRLVLAPPPRTDLGNSRPSDESFLPLFGTFGMGLAATVLVVACLNLANLLLARGTVRQKEIGIRLSLGATRGRIVRQLLTEGLLLALLGGALGLLVSAWSNQLLLRISTEAFNTGMFTLSTHSFVDGPMIGAVFIFCLLATLAANLGPALRLTRLDLVTDLKQQSGESSARGRGSRFFSLNHCLLMGQIALSLVLLFSAALFVRGSWRARATDLGFKTRDQLVANLDYRRAHLPHPELARRQAEVLARAAALPGVSQVALASAIPYNFSLPFENVSVAGGPAVPTREGTVAGHYAGFTAVSSGYFSTLGISLLRGRDFTAAESSGNEGPRVVVIDETLARALFGDGEALGRLVFAGKADALSGDLERASQIVGIVRSPRNDVFEKQAPRRFYRPLGQARPANVYLHAGTAVPLAVIGSLRRELLALDSDTPVLFVRPLADFVEKNINTLIINLAGMIFGVLGGIALLLAVVGIYGVKAQAVAQRTREIGIRMALGARPGEVVALIVKQGVWQILAGLGAGLALALLVGRLLAQMLYRVSPWDPVALVVSAVLLALAALLACLVPARRAAKVDPVIALRAE